MAKKLLHSVLVKVLGEFIDLNEENLNLAVWNGQIVLNNLNLKTDQILKNFNLNVFHGTIQRLEVTIPWATLLINPVKIVISGVLLDVGPLDIAKLGKVEALKRYMAEKLQKLKMVDQYLELSLNLKTDGQAETNEAPDNNSESYIQQWSAKVIDNIEIKVSDLHVRYEDSLSIPGRVFACGITLESFGISTCDNNWNIAGSTRGTDPTGMFKVNKLAYLKSLGVYWQVDASSLAHMPLKEWERLMMMYIVRESTTPPASMDVNPNKSFSSQASYPQDAVLQPREYILSPYNNTLTVKLTQNKKPTATSPKFDIRAESSNLQIQLDSVQYVELFSVMDRLGALGKMYKPKTYRPYDRPIDRESCVAWWKYACKLAVKVRKYIDLVKLSLRLAAGREDPHTYLPYYAAKEMRYLEERLPFEPLRVGRQRAMLEIFEEHKQQQRLLTRGQTPSKSSGWFGSWSSSSNNGDTFISPLGSKSTSGTIRNDEDISIESIMAALNEPEQSTKSKQSKDKEIVVSMIRLSLESSSTALISHAFQPLVQCNSALSLSFTKTSSGMSFKCNLNDLYVLDRFTVNPPVPYIVAVKSDLSYVQRSLQLDKKNNKASAAVTTSTFSVLYERLNGKSKVVIAALPIELCLNKDCIQMILNTFSRPVNKYAIKETVKTAKRAAAKPQGALSTAQLGIENLRNVSQHNDDIELILQASAPKIIIPESSEDSGYVLVDCGNLELKGFLGTTGMSMSLGLHQLNVGMPLTVRDMYKHGEKALYLIKPFDILMHVQNIDQSEAGLTVNVEVKPEIRGEVDSVKLARLLTALGQVSGIFAKLPVSPVASDLESIKAPGAAAAGTEVAANSLDIHLKTPLYLRTVKSFVRAPPRTTATIENVVDAAVDAAQVPVPAVSTSTSASTVTSLSVQTPSKVAQLPHLSMGSDSPGSDDGFHTPLKDRASLASVATNSAGGSGASTTGASAKGGTVNQHFTPNKSAALNSKTGSNAKNAANTARSPEQPAQDPTIVNMRIDVLLPVVALDLTYDVQRGYHLVLEVNTLRTLVSSRPYDRSIIFEMSEMSMRDSFRAEAQQHLIWTPPDFGKLVHFSYINMSNKLSPYYNNHATEIVMNFANLGLNVDVNTIKHLRPFFEVLLSRREPASPDPNAAGNDPNATNAPSAASSPRPSSDASKSPLASQNDLLALNDPSTPPTGTCVTATLERISLDFLRAPLVEKKGALLETAFSAQISGMRCDMNMQGLMVAEVRLRSFEIIDMRHISSDYVFKKIFCPAFENLDLVNRASSADLPMLNSSVAGQPSALYTNSVARSEGSDSPADLSLSSVGYALSLKDLDVSAPQTPRSTSQASPFPAADNQKNNVDYKKEKNLLFVVFRQQSSAHNHFDIEITDITAFIAIDTILDLTSVVLANLFAFFGLLAAPTPPVTESSLSKKNSSSFKDTPSKTAGDTAGRNSNPAAVNRSVSTRSIPLQSLDSSSDEAEPSGAAQSSFREVPEVVGNILSAMLHITNPRLIFLEDPSTVESQAIVGTCGVVLNFTRETKNRLTTVSMFESLHVTLSKYEVYVLKNMTKWYPQPILEPMELELHLKRRVVDGVTKMMSLHVEVDNIDTQVSFNDIILAQSILSRRVLSDAPPAEAAPPAAEATASGTTKTETGDLSPTAPIDPLDDSFAQPEAPVHSIMNFQFGMGTLSMVIINDFNGQSIPIIKTTVNNTFFGMESAGPRVSGDGSMEAKVDFFNTRLSTWEPILDIWQPSARIYSMNDTKIFEIKSEYTMQLTVSGIILETLLRSYSLFFHDLDVLAERTALSGVSVCNLLGDVVEVQLRDSASNQVLLNLAGGQTGLVTSLQDQSGKIWSKSMNLPSSVDLHFKGMFKAQRMPLFHLPLNINRPKAYNLQPAPHCADYAHEAASPLSPIPSSPQPSDSVWVTKPSVKTKVYVIEPIVEEVYENARYDPMSGTWRKPYFMGDPYEWTDGSGTIRKDIGSIELVSDRWEWQGKWEVDLDGQIGVEIDAQGWEYANSFSFFTMVSVRRASQAMDGCRRRRWTRTRIPRASSTSLLERPLTLFWDVQVQKNGARRIDLRSALQFSNQISFPVIISLQQSAWDREVELGPIAPGAVYSVPLLYSYASAVRFRPDFPLYEWSDYYPCSTHAYDFTRTKSATCAGSEAEINPIWFRIHTTQTSKSVMVNIVPYISITNKLLCDMRIRCVDKNRVAEEGEIESGRDMKMSFINVSNQPMLSIKVGNFDWSEAIMLCVNKDSASLFELFLPGRKRATKLYLSMNSKLCPIRGVSIEIFSKVAIIDRTSLHLFVASKLRPGVNLVRSTCATLKDFSKSHTQQDKVHSDSTAAATEEDTALAQPDAVENDSAKMTVAESSAAEPTNLHLKMPLNASRTVSVSSTDSRNNSHQHLAHLLAAPLQDGSESPGLSRQVKNSFSYSSNYPENATVRVDNTPYTKGITANLQTGTRAQLASGETVLPDLRDDKAGEELPTLGQAVLVKDIEVSSRNKYQLLRSAPGQRVYSDHKMRWCYLPPCLLDQLQLRTPHEDRLQRTNRLVQFTTTAPCMLLVLVDINAPLKWLLAEGFTLVREIATARCVNRGSLEELHFAIYGKICEADQRVVLRASWNKATLTMYSLFFLPIDAESSTARNGLGTAGQPAPNATGVSKAVSGAAPSAAADQETDDAAAMRADSLDSLFRQLNFKNSYSRELATRSWTEGSNNLSLMYTYDNIITVGLCKGKVWSREINIDTRKNAVSKGSFEVENVESNISYQLSYGLHALPGLYSETQLIYFMPKYCILNCTEEVLLVSQRGSEKYLQYLPYRPEGWHKLELESGTEVQLRTASTVWSLGSIDINDIGSSVVYIPYRDAAVLDPTKPSNNNNNNTKEAPSQGIVLHVEVKLADPTDHCSIIVIIWQETIESRAAMSIRNTSDVAITIRQAEIEMDHEIQDQEHLFELCVPPGCSVPFGWADPESGTDVLVTVGEGLKGQNKRIASINMLKPDQLLRLPYNFGRYNAKGEVVISVSTNNSGHVLEVFNLSKSSFLNHGDTESDENTATEVAADMDLRQRNQAFPTYGFNFLLSSFGVSLVVEKPQRREFLSLYIDWLEVLVRMKGSMRSLEFVIMDLQVDNYSETVIYPVLLRSRKKEIRRSVTLGGDDATNTNTRNRQESNILTQSNADSIRSTSSEDYQRKPDDPFVKLTIIQEVPADGSQAVFKYVACRVLSLAVEVDSATVQLLFTDLLDDLKILTHSQALALSMPDRWLNEFNMKQLYPQQQLRMVKVYRSKIQAQQSKMYFKNLIIHPIKITFTFAQTTFPRRQHKETLQSTVLNILMSLVGVEKLRLHLRSFEVEDAMESFGSLADMISSKTIQDVRSQLTQIAGSLTMLGSPIGFARKVGSGVKAFFYEPYQGAVQGSGDFVAGLGRGTSTLFTGVVSGAMDSAVAIVGTASKGMSHLSGDADYVRKRAIKRQQGKVNRGGILEGIREGGESVLSGISSGVTGLVTKPIEEASKSGFGGFFKGLGLGLIGVAVKPVIGFSDGLTSVAQGISNQVDPAVKTSHVRPPRALEPSAIDPANLVVVPLNLEAAFAQEFIAKRAKQNQYEDSFLRFIPLETKGEAIILSHIYVFWRRKSSLWGRVWANISHCVYMNDSVGIMLYSGGKNGGASLVTIPCKSVQTAKRVYAALAQNTSRMGNPSNVIPIDIVMKSGTLTPSASREQDLHTLLRDGRRTTQKASDALRQVVDESQLGALDGYRFGTANGTVLTQITGSEDDVLKRAAHHLEKEIGSWQRVDQHIWRLLWEWGCIHSNLSACRCSVTLLINRSDSPIQITRVQLVIGRNVLIIGSSQTGYEAESRSLMPEGMMIVFICAFPESPLDIGHLKANINTAAFSAVVASTQRESFCEAKGGFTIGFLEKTMAIRCGYTVGRTTGESSLTDQLHIYKPRKIAVEEVKKPSHRPPNPAHEKLSTKCIRVVVENFGERPVKEVIPPPQMAEITKMLPTNLNPLIGARYIYNESYWKRCCVDKYGWHNCHLHEHNLLWKQLFFEKLLQETLEDFDAVTEDPDIIYELIDAAMDYIFTLSFKQLPSHIELFEVCDMLPNLTKLDITYGVKKIGMNYERMLFGMKISDATSLAKIFDHTDTLTTVMLSGNMIDDDLLRMLMTGLIKNNTITHLDVSHNKITNHGARLLSKLLGENSVLTTLNLSDNQIHAEGGRYLARGLRENDSLLQLNLRLNRLTDEGCSLLLEGLRDNVNLIELNLGSNGAGSQSAQILFSIVRDPEHSLQVLDMSGNELNGEHFEQMRLSMSANSSITSLDLRRNPGYEISSNAVAELEKIVHANEYKARTAAGHP